MATATALRVEMLRDEIRRRFPGALLPTPGPGGGALPVPEPGSPDALGRLLGWPLPDGALLRLVGKGSTFLAWSLLARTIGDEHMRAGYVDGTGSFFPPGAAVCGVDLAHLLWVGMPDARRCLRAAELMIESHCLGLVVLDPGPGSLPTMACRRLGFALARGRTRLVLVERAGLSHALRPSRSVVVEGCRPRWRGDSVRGGVDGWSLTGRADGAGFSLKVETGGS